VPRPAAPLQRLGGSIMTTMGKILVFINLLFSVLTGALIVMVFITRTNWAKGVDDLKADLFREHTNRLNKEAEVKQLEGLIRDKEKAENAEIAQLKTDKEMAEKVRDDAVAKMREAEGRATEATLNANKATAVAEAMKVEIRSLDERLQAEQERVRDLGKQVKEAKAAQIKAETDLRAALDRNDQLLKKYVESERQLAVARGEQAKQVGRDAPNPPPDDIYGRVMVVDDATGWVTINLGSDSGLLRGNTLEVYRLKPRPTYIGTLRVYEVKPHEAIGKLMSGATRGRIQKDDEVASRILGAGP
jgi:hypothetical protein